MYDASNIHFIKINESLRRFQYTNKWLWTYPIARHCLTFLITLFFHFMPYIHNELYYSLQEVLRHPRCASQTWMEDATFDLGFLRIRNSNVRTRFRSEKKPDPLPIAFPARLNLKGTHSNITFDINIENQKYVRHIINSNLHFKDLTMQKPRSNTAESMRATFQLSPLSEISSKDEDIPHEAIECSAIASKLLRSCDPSIQIEHHCRFPFII